MTIAGVRKIEGFSKNLLTRARVASRLAPLNLNKIVLDFVEFMKFLPRFKSNTITTALDARIPVINLDLDQIQQVLLNLMNNIVEARRDATIHIQTEFQSSLNEVRFSVGDNGPGIEESVLPKLFVERVSSKVDGHGLGLTVCRHIVESHGGSIRAESSKGEGATFIITFPIATENK
jgi:signal transduction histidine kinase